VDQQPGLLANHRDNPRMRVSQRIHADAGDEIQVTMAFQIVNMAALSAREDQRITGVVLQHVIPLQVHRLLGGLIHSGGGRARHLLIIARPAVIQCAS
jgi:hypothetical protein